MRKAVTRQGPLLAGRCHREPPRDGPLRDTLLTLVDRARLNECQRRSKTDPLGVLGLCGRRYAFLRFTGFAFVLQPIALSGDLHDVGGAQQTVRPPH